MKKGLLTLLAASLVFVGCQNYDDQFDDLNAQISALKSQVDGLSALSSQVASLSSTVSSLQAGISAAQAAAAAAGTEAAAATAAATQAGADAVAAAEEAAAAAVAAGATAKEAADAATAAATAAGATAAEALTAATEAAANATAAGAAAVAAAEDAAAQAVAAGADAEAAADAAYDAAVAAGADAVAAANAASAAAVAAGVAAEEAADAATAAAVAAGADAVAAAAAAEAAADAATTQAATNATDLAALAADLAEIQTELAEIQATLATVSTAEEVAALQADIDALEADVEDLMNSTNVMQDALTIASVNDLDAAFDLGNKINIVNNDVTITLTADMDAAELQTVIDRIFTINGALSFTDNTSGTAMVTFDNLTTTENLTLTSVEGAISFAALLTTEVVAITEATDDDGDGLVTSLSMPVLTSITSINTGTIDEIDFAGAGTSVDLGALVRYGEREALTVALAGSGTLDIGSLVTTDVDGDEISGYDLTLSGLTEFTVDGPVGYNGTLTVSDIPTVTVNTWGGTIDVNADVTTLTVVDGYNLAIDGAEDLTTATIDMTFDTDSTDATLDADDNAAGNNLNSLAFTSANAVLTDVTVSGNLLDLSFTNVTVLDDITVSATMRNLTVTGNDELTAFDVSDASMADITFTSNEDITSVTFDHTANLAYSLGDADETQTNFTFTGNVDVTSLTYSGSTVADFQVTGNDALATVDFSGVTTVDTTTASEVDIDVSDNNLSAASITETSEDDTTGTTDDGTSGMATIADLLAAAADVNTSAVNVYFDSAEVVTAEAGEVNSGNDVTYVDADGTTADDDEYLVVMVKGDGTDFVAGDAATTQKTAFGVETGADDTLVFTLNGVDIDFGTMTGDAETDYALVLASAAVDTALDANAIVGAKLGYNSSTSVTFSLLTAGTTTLYGERYETAATVTAAAAAGDEYGVGAYDQWTITVGTESATTSLTADDTTDATDLVAALVSAWGDLDSDIIDLAVNGDDSNIIDVTANASSLDSASYNLAVSVSVTDSTTASTVTSDAVDYIIGATRLDTDNNTLSNGFLVTFTSTAEGATANTIVTLTDNSSTATVTELTDLEDGTTDMDTAEDAGADTAADDGITIDRSGWLS